jgi:hypothetical protein
MGTHYRLAYNEGPEQSGDKIDIDNANDWKAMIKHFSKFAPMRVRLHVSVIAEPEESIGEGRLQQSMNPGETKSIASSASHRSRTKVHQVMHISLSFHCVC